MVSPHPTLPSNKSWFPGPLRVFFKMASICLFGISTGNPVSESNRNEVLSVAGSLNAPREMSLCKAMENTKKRYPRVSISFFALARISSWLNTNHWTPAKYYWNIIASFCAVEYGKVGNGDILFFSRHCIDSVSSKFESHNSSFQVKTDIWTFLLDNFHPSQQGKIPDARERKHYLPTPAWGAIVLDRWRRRA